MDSIYIVEQSIVIIWKNKEHVMVEESGALNSSLGGY